MSIQYPSSWVENEANNISENMAHPMFEVLDPSDNSTSAMIADVGMAKSLESLVNYYELYANGTAPNTTPATGPFGVTRNSKIISENNTTINGLKACQIISETNDGSDKNMVVIIEKTPGQQYYEIYCSCQSSIFDQQKKNFELIINSFQTS
jgi:hypothetical protein